MEKRSLASLAGWTVGVWWLAHALLIAGHVGLVFLYSVAVAPGLEHADYMAFAERSGPWFSIVAGIPVFFALGRLLRRTTGPAARRVGLWAWGLYTLTDATLVLASGVALTALFVGQWLTSQTVKLIAIYLGARPAVELVDA